jgi:hypothetical protein
MYSIPFQVRLRLQEDIEGAAPGHSRRVTPRDADLDAWVSATQRLRGGMTVEQVAFPFSIPKHRQNPP